MKKHHPIITRLEHIRQFLYSLSGGISLLVFSLLLPLMMINTAAADGCVTADCHASLGKAEFVHEPVKASECDACHVETGKNHPDEPGAFELAEKGIALCLQCHDNPLEGKEHSHPPVEEDCIKCHNPHQSSQLKFLHTSPGKLCLSCHEKIQNIITESRAQLFFFFFCECLSCHVPHASDYSPMLNTFYPRNMYLQFAVNNFALCLECHDKEAFTLEKTTEVTQFRNGDRNLHYVHVNRAKGRTCINCHGVHGADLEKLIHSSSPAFGVWNIPIDFQKTKTGATCVIGCHKEKSYDRHQAAVDK